jgi:hypothetical protein
MPKVFATIVGRCSAALSLSSTMDPLYNTRNLSRNPGYLMDAWRYG